MENKREQTEEKKSRSWWVKLLRGLGFALLGAVIVVIIVCSAVVWFLSPERLGPIIERVASNNLNAEVTVGRAELTFWSSFPHIKVELDGLELVSRSLSGVPDDVRSQLPAGADSVLSIGHFSGSLNLVKIINGEIVLSDVEIDRPRVRLVQVNDTLSNFDIFPVSEPDTTMTSTSAIPPISLNHFAITNALPICYTSVADSMEVAVTLRTLDVSGDEAPRYGLSVASNIDLPMLQELDFDNTEFALDGGIRWSGESPMEVGLEEFRFALNDEINLTLDTRVNFADDLRIEGLTMALAPVKVADMIKHLPADMAQPFAGLDTDMAIGVTAQMAEPVVIGDTLLLPCAEVGVEIPKCYVKYGTVDFRELVLSATAQIDGGNLDASIVELKQLEIDGRAMDISLSGRLSSLLSDPKIKGRFCGTIDFGALPPIIRRQLDASLTGTLSANTDIALRLSDLTPGKFHRAQVSGDVNLRNMHFVSADSSTMAYTRHAELKFGTNKVFSRGDSIKADSLLMVNLTVDTAYVITEGLETELKGLRAGLGTKNISSSTDSTLINPFGGAIHLASLRYNSPADSMKIRLGDIGGYASLQRYEGASRVPQLSLRLAAGRMFLMQTEFGASLRDARFDLSANLNPRRRPAGSTAPQGAQPKGDAPVARRGSGAERARQQGLSAEQLDSIGVDLIDYNVDNSLRSLLRRWKVNGSITAARGRVRLASLPLRNTFGNLNLDFTTDSITLRSLDYRIGHSDFAVTGKISNLRQALASRRPRPLNVDLKINSDTINVNELVRSLAMAEVAATDSISDMSQLEEMLNEEDLNIEQTEAVPDSLVGPILIPVNIDADFDITAENVVYSDLVLNRFHGQLLVGQGAVNLNDLSGSTSAGDISVSGLYRAPTSRDMSFALGMSLRNFHIARLPQVVPAIDSLLPMMSYFSGVVNAQIAVTTDLTPDMYFDMPSLKAAMQFDGDSLVVFDNATFRSLSKWLLFKNKQRNMIDHLNIELTVDSGMLNLYPFMVDIDRYKLGVMGYSNMNFDLNYHISVLKSPIPFKFGINIKGTPEDMKIRLGGAKFKENMVAQRDSVAINTRISLVQEINSAFRRGLRAARLGPLRIRGNVDRGYMQGTDAALSTSDSLTMIREGLIEVPDSVAAAMEQRLNPPPAADDAKK